MISKHTCKKRPPDRDTPGGGQAGRRLPAPVRLSFRRAGRGQDFGSACEGSAPRARALLLGVLGVLGVQLMRCETEVSRIDRQLEALKRVAVLPSED